MHHYVLHIVHGRANSYMCTIILCTLVWKLTSQVSMSVHELLRFVNNSSAYFIAFRDHQLMSVYFQNLAVTTAGFLCSTMRTKGGRVARRSAQISQNS